MSHWCDLCHGITTGGSPCAPLEYDWEGAYCKKCDKPMDFRADPEYGIVQESELNSEYCTGCWDDELVQCEGCDKLFMPEEQPDTTYVHSAYLVRPNWPTVRAGYTKKEEAWYAYMCSKECAEKMRPVFKGG